MSRRDFLAVGGAAVIGLAGATLPAAHADATLAVEIAVTEVEWAGVDEETHDREADALGLEVVSEVTRPVEPVVFLWSRYNGMMQAWTQTAGPDRLDPGERVELRVEAPAPETRLYPAQPAQVTVVEAGTERRAKTTFVPEPETRSDGER